MPARLVLGGRPQRSANAFISSHYLDELLSRLEHNDTAGPRKNIPSKLHRPTQLRLTMYIISSDCTRQTALSTRLVEGLPVQTGYSRADGFFHDALYPSRIIIIRLNVPFQTIHVNSLNRSQVPASGRLSPSLFPSHSFGEKVESVSHQGFALW